MRRSVVVGLGYASEPVLARIAAEFRARGAAAWNGPAGAGEFDEIDDQGMTGDLRLLWLLPGSPPEAMPDPVPVTGPGDRIDLAPFALDLALTPADLSKLYYQPEVCTWSGPNWREWGDAIRYNRLLGRLALYHHRRRVGDRVIALINHLSRQDSLPLNLYLVAPLVDPFASGAMLDVAYLLDRIAVNRNARVYGLLVLPDTAGLPFWSDEQDSSPLAVSDGEGVQGDEADIAANLGYATAYAALRELNFVLGPRSFYQSHHPEPGYRIERTDESPFQSGDCYLLGGHLDEARRSIDWDTVVGQTAR
ncbi:MAG: hypothetical protein JXQ72_04255, partial [Anaerolineae bacterium]|nr:hypothetical protein [Anaerolineae bacterium]